MSAWKEAKAPDGRKYYYVPGTSQTRWDKPDDFDEAATPAAPAHDPAAVDAAWKQTSTEDGRKYYYNAITKVTSWEPPAAYLAQQSNARPAPPAFVAGGTHRQEDDNYRPRERRKDDRDHGLPQRPGFEAGRSGGTPWEQRQDSTGFRGAMPIKTDEPEYATPELAEEAFFKLLRKHNISPETPWQQALRVLIQERDYRAIKSPRERKEAFEKYCIDLRAQEKEREKERRERTKEEFRKMLSTHDEIKHYTRWKTARPIIEREAVFKSAGDEDERRQMYDEYVLELKKRNAEDDIATRSNALQDLDVLLQALVDNPDTTWSEAREDITNNDRFAKDSKFRSLNNVDLLVAFDNHVKALDRVRNEAKQRDKRLRTRRQRQARDGFKQLLSQMQKQGKIRAGTKWQDFHPLIAEDERYLALIGNPGSNALDLFWDVVEEEERKMRLLSSVAIDVLEERRFGMHFETPLANFVAVLRSDSRTDRLRDEDMELLFERLTEKAKKRAEDDRVYSERHQRKAIDALRSLIKHLDPPVSIGDSYEDVVPRLQEYEEFRALDDNEARRSAFEKHIRRLKEKEDDLERERTRRDRDRDRDRDHRNGSRRGAERDRERDRGHRRTPEVDPYEADRRKAQADRERQYRKASFGLTPPPRDRRDERDDRHRRHDRGETLSIYDRERREREMERERSYISRADPRDKGRSLDYGDEDAGSSRPGSIRKRRDSDGSAGGRRDAKRPRRGRTRTPEMAEAPVKEESPALQSGSEEGEIEEV